LGPSPCPQKQPSQVILTVPGSKSIRQSALRQRESTRGFVYEATKPYTTECTPKSPTPGHESGNHVPVVTLSHAFPPGTVSRNRKSHHPHDYLPQTVPVPIPANKCGWASINITLSVSLSLSLRDRKRETDREKERESRGLKEFLLDIY
jgi:hypothetical protein